MAAWDEMVLVGHVVRPHHNRGQVLVASASDFPEARFAAGKSVWCRRGGQDQRLRVTECRMHDGKPIVGFEGFESINDAETLRGCELRVPEADLPALDTGQFWHHQLIGCVVTTSAGQVVGEVIRVDDGATALLVVKSGASTPAGAEEVLIPLVSSICTSIDVGSKAIVIEPIAGLLDVNRLIHSDSQ